jgi:hypothetical protein
MASIDAAGARTFPHRFRDDAMAKINDGESKTFDISSLVNRYQYLNR